MLGGGKRLLARLSLARLTRRGQATRLATCRRLCNALSSVIERMTSGEKQGVIEPVTPQLSTEVAIPVAPRQAVPMAAREVRAPGYRVIEVDPARDRQIMLALSHVFLVLGAKPPWPWALLATRCGAGWCAGR
jgi:hypothetical protein